MGNLDSLPKKVKRAILKGDEAAITSMARAGGRVAGEKRHIESRDRKDAAAYYEEKAAQDERKREESANEHVVPIDPEH